MTAAAIRAVLFDLGGVLLPFDLQRRIDRLVRRFGCAADAASDFMTSDACRGLDSGATTEHDLASDLSRRFGEPVGPAEAIELLLSTFEPPNHDLWALARGLKGRAMVGGFSDNPAWVRRMFPHDDVLDPMIFSADIRACKPTPEAFAAAEARLGVPPASILFVDDTARNVQAARARGWDAVCFTGNAALVAELAQRGLA